MELSKSSNDNILTALQNKLKTVIRFIYRQVALLSNVIWNSQAVNVEFRFYFLYSDLKQTIFKDEEQVSILRHIIYN